MELFSIIIICCIVLLIIAKIFKIPSLAWLTPVIVYASMSLIFIHSVLISLRNTSIYIFPTYFALILIAPLLASKIIFPYIISPRRFYASLLKLDHDPWHPPTGPMTFVIVQSILIAYLLAISYFTLKLVALKRCGTYNKSVTSKYAIKMTTFAYFIYLIFRYSPILGASVDLLFSWLPFAGDMIMGVPMATLCLLMLLFRYEEAVVHETNGTTLNRLTFWQNII